jgi:hypothetical protein
MIEAGAPSTEEATLVHREGTRPTGDSHDRITDDRAQRGERRGRKGRPRQGAFKKRGRGQYKGRSPAESRPEVLE